MENRAKSMPVNPVFLSEIWEFLSNDCRSVLPIFRIEQHHSVSYAIDNLGHTWGKTPDLRDLCDRLIEELVQYEDYFDCSSGDDFS